MRRIVGLLCVVALTWGCTSSKQVTPAARGSGAVAAGARFLLIESDIKFYVLTAGGVSEPQPDWTEKARSNFVSATRRELAKHGHSLTTVDANVVDETLTRYEKLHRAVAGAIFGYPMPSKHGAFDYSLGPGVAVLKDRYAADYALFVSYRDTRASGGQQAKAFFAGMFGVYGFSLGGQGGFASLVDLTTGDVVWCRVVNVGTGDLREPEGADKTVSVLFEGMPGG
jgi:hypothetical protein